MMLDAALLIRLHDEATAEWHRTLAASDADVVRSGLGGLPASEMLQIVLAQHRANFDLWHEEDKARDPLATDAQVTEVKHAIDAMNQRRNDLVEALDRFLLQQAGQQAANAPLHSESPGLMVDRLSILALKLYHTGEECHRASATGAHRDKNTLRLDLLQEQRSDLAACLQELWRQVLAGERRFKLYRQMKMYNDPELNPVVYARRSS